jgi:hypothetical protein
MESATVQLRLDSLSSLAPVSPRFGVSSHARRIAGFFTMSGHLVPLL